jgi:hypothetical protein
VVTNKVYVVEVHGYVVKKNRTPCTFALRFNSHFARLALSLTRKLGSGSEIKSESFWAFSLYFARLALSLTRKLGGGSEIKSESFCTFALYFARLALTLANKRTGGATIDVVTPLKCCLKLLIITYNKYDKRKS